ncbi:dienelactone hydrolase family protein [Ferrovibrio xuzhouensis]|uniref:Dienelactone hydrolase family protein n=1 Tax=Ferrovibrio xuzhouensis TaxID=1576914 RepID=A0ABV7VBM2_9PROT
MTQQTHIGLGRSFSPRLVTSNGQIMELPAPVDEIVAIPPFGLDGHLTLPVQARSVVVFAHGSGSSRHSPRNKYVAQALARAGFGTLLFDLLLPQEGTDRAATFDIDLLADRLILATQWLRRRIDHHPVDIGYFGASTGAAAALVAAARQPEPVKAIVCRGGRPDLAGPFLADVRAPTLFIVGGMDTEVLALNRWASSQMTCKTTLKVVPDASHLFEEVGALDQVIDCAAFWFRRYLLHADSHVQRQG